MKRHFQVSVTNIKSKKGGWQSFVTVEIPKGTRTDKIHDMVSKKAIKDDVTYYAAEIDELTPAEMKANSKTSVWDFVTKHYPDYDHSDEIANNDDLCKLVDKEYEDEDCAHRLLMSEYDGNIDNPQIKIDFELSNASVFEQAIQGFIDKDREKILKNRK